MSDEAGEWSLADRAAAEVRRQRAETEDRWRAGAARAAAAAAYPDEILPLVRETAREAVRIYQDAGIEPATLYVRWKRTPRAKPQWVSTGIRMWAIAQRDREAMPSADADLPELLLSTEDGRLYTNLAQLPVLVQPSEPTRAEAIAGLRECDGRAFFKDASGRDAIRAVVEVTVLKVIRDHAWPGMAPGQTSLGWPPFPLRPPQPGETRGVEPQPAPPWSAEDGRLLLITVGGGLAANLATVLIVGIAAALIYLLRQYHHGHDLAVEIVSISVSLVVLLGAVVVAAYVRVVMNPGVRRGPDGRNPFRRQIWLAGLLLAMLLLVWVGLAAGIK
jgi:hypothetical protein